MSETHLRGGMLVFPDMTQPDLTGPYEVLARLPGAEILLLWKSLDPVRSEHGLTILPMAALSSCPPLDLVLVPGGAGINPLLKDAEILGFLRRVAAEACYVVGVCTGSLVSAPPDCFAGGVPRRTGCRASCCARSVPLRWPTVSSSTANSSPAAVSPLASTWP